MIIQGNVIKGKGRGRQLGFPTANIEVLSSEVKIKDPEFHGVYASIIEIDGNFYYSATSIGKNETFNENEITVETYIFNFNQDIYNKKVSLNLVSKIRPMKKFDTIEQLKNEIKEDIKKAKAILYQLKFFNH
jgi:riboflavin kinase/FMN adenylyltransferase